MTPAVPRLTVALAAVALLLAFGACGGGDDGTDATAGPSSSTPARDNPDQPTGATMKQHWHAAFGVQVCGQLLAPVTDAGPDRTGLHSHGDGLMHIHPFTPAASGDNANLAAFFDTIGYEVSDEALVTPKGTLRTAVGCDGTPATIRLLVDGTPWTGDIDAFRPQDGQVLQLLFDTPDAPAVDLPWADEVRSPGDVRALERGPSPPVSGALNSPERAERVQNRGGSDHGGAGGTV